MYRRLARREHRYPLQDMPLWAKRAVLDAIQVAYRSALEDGEPFKDENHLSGILVDGLNEVRRDAGQVPAFSADLFQVVNRDGCTATFDGASLDKRPDMIFRLAGALDQYDGWFAECKIVDATHRPGLYLSEGVNRFITGDYAWAMPSALMLAYAGEGYSVGRVRSLDTAAWEHDPNLAASTHPRSWCYPGTTRMPGPVCLLHVWLFGASFAPPDRVTGSGTVQ